MKETYTKETGKPRKKKKRKKKRYLLKFFLFVLIAVGAYFLLTSGFFDIGTIEVENNAYYTKEQIVSIAGVKTGGNIFTVSMSDIKKRLLKDPYIKNAKVYRKLPDAVVISLEERKEYAAVVQENTVIGSIPAQAQMPAVTQEAIIQEGQAAVTQTTSTAAAVTPAATAGTTPPASAPADAIPVYGTAYVLIDSDGLVLRKTDKAPALTLLYGLTVKTAEPGKALEVEENSMFSDTLSMLSGMEKNELYFKKIVVSPVVIHAYIFDNLVCEGTPENILNGMGQLSEMLQNLYSQGIERGVIIVGSDGYLAHNPLVQE